MAKEKKDVLEEVQAPANEEKKAAPKKEEKEVKLTAAMLKEITETIRAEVSGEFESKLKSMEEALGNKIDPDLETDAYKNLVPQATVYFINEKLVADISMDRDTKEVNEFGIVKHIQDYKITLIDIETEEVSKIKVPLRDYISLRSAETAEIHATNYATGPNGEKKLNAETYTMKLRGGQKFDVTANVIN